MFVRTCACVHAPVLSHVSRLAGKCSEKLKTRLARVSCLSLSPSPRALFNSFLSWKGEKQRGGDVEGRFLGVELLSGGWRLVG